ncbi:MarR family winged helix-turn-helix transcriptional regulator [Streptomyces prunicolor]|uniref:MarR family winged helix-turn-helix transcriptional regulator n=1 Tax=Streptomyces prunicolor TaxID=67348 RepID=UPI0003764C05|nr:MarR family transcriptional regulator [Streptomyces prunicolor]
MSSGTESDAGSDAASGSVSGAESVSGATSGAVEARLGAAVQAYQSAVDDFDRELARLMGVNETDLRCLEILFAVEEITPRELSRQLGLTTGSVTTMLDRLEKLAYLTRTPHPDDRRKTLIRVTPEATQCAFGLIGPFLEDAGRKVFDRYTPEQLELVIDYLTFSRDIQQQHVERLRKAPAAGPTRTGGRQVRGPRGGSAT